MAEARDFFVRTSAGPLLGAAGSFVVTARGVNGSMRTAPTIIELGEGMYRFVVTDADEAVGTVVHIDCGVGREPRRYTAACFKPDRSNQFWAIGVQNPDGSDWTGAPPTIGSYRSSAGPRTPPPVVAVAGAYLFVVVPTAADVEADVAIRIDGPTGSAQPTWHGDVKPVVRDPAVSSGFTFSVTPAPSTGTASATAGENAERDFKLSSATGDLELAGGDLQMLTGAAGIASDLASTLQTFAGEYFLDTTLGVPRSILGSKFSRGRLEDVFREQILSRPGVGSIASLEVTLDARTLRVSFRVVADFGDIIEGTLQQVIGG